MPRVACECPQHLSELVTMLGQFEAYSADCESRQPADVTLHAYLYRVAGHARALMEEALATVAKAEGGGLAGASPGALKASGHRGHRPHRLSSSPRKPPLWCAHRRAYSAALGQQLGVACPVRRCGPGPARSGGPSRRWWTGGGRWPPAVLPSIRRYRLAWMAASTSESSALVASSSSRMGASSSITRAMAMRWRCPPDSFTPRSPTWAS